MRTIEWPEEPETAASTEPSERAALGRVARTPTTMAVGTAMMDDTLRSASGPRGVLAVAIFVAILVLLGVLLLFFGPLPRVFPTLS